MFDLTKPQFYSLWRVGKIISLQEIGSGERVSHFYRNSCYYAHLSIYGFALPFARNGLVLDAGCGAGYGSAYLADHGARYVWGIDFSAKTIAFDYHHFRRSNLQFQAMDLQKICGFPDQSFDLIFSSNTLEHIPDVTAFLRTARRLLKPDGVVVVVIPPVTDEEGIAFQLENPYHLNIWSPRQWYHTLNLYFEDIQPYRHGCTDPRITDLNDPSDQTPISEKDFTFEPVSLEALYQAFTFSAVFIARKPRQEDQLPPPDSPLTFVDHSFTRPPVLSPARSWRDLLKRARYVASRQGFRPLVQRTIFFLVRKWAKVGD